MSSFRRLTGAAVGVLCVTAGAAAAVPAIAAVVTDACATRDKCMDAIMEAARDGRQLDEMALMRALPRNYGTRPSPSGTHAAPDRRNDDALAVGEPDTVLIALLRDANRAGLSAPERQRALALAYLQANKPADAELELDEAIANQPSHAPYWLDLAEVYARQGRRDKAAAALVVATGWTVDADALRQAYARAAQRGGTGAPYAQALQLLGARTEALARREAALAPRPLAKDRGVKGEPMPIMRVDTCIKPEYPRSSLRNEETGMVQLDFLVDAEGKPVEIRKVRSSGYADLDNATLLSLSACSFKPLVVDGKPAAAWAAVQYVWTLE
ncbi:energy transducer TonB [Massilia phyllosphaerae]|uniref:energy transducer TonB n=1 Tax=Massilia phyllosphaerae TaxID=3106034 RepID=UPI002B1CC9B4|nr:TonB family protein [Massilia sp. SGZ-792]